MGARVAVVVNPASGRGKARRLLPAVTERLAGIEGGAEILLSDGPEHPPRLVAEAVQNGAEIVAAMGGDGMAGMVSEALIGTPTALALIPTGTGNDFAVALGLKRKRPLEALEALFHPRFVEIDAALVRCGGVERSFVNVAGAGFDAEVNDTANRMRTRVEGTAKYVAAVMKTLPGFKAARFDVKVDGAPHTLPGMLIAVGNGVSYGGGMKICPDADLGDGMLDLTVIGAMSKPQFLWNFPTVFRGTHVRHPKVTTLRGTKVEIGADRELQVYADGERVGPLPATFEVIPKALRVALPEGARG